MSRKKLKRVVGIEPLVGTAAVLLRAEKELSKLITVAKERGWRIEAEEVILSFRQPISILRKNAIAIIETKTDWPHESVMLGIKEATEIMDGSLFICDIEKN